MSHTSLFIALFLLIHLSQAQTQGEDLTKKLPYSSIKESIQIYVLTVKEWEKEFSHEELEINWDHVIASPHVDTLIFGYQNDRSKNRQTRAFNTKDLTFSEPRWSETLNISQALATNEKELYLQVEKNASDLLSSRIETIRFVGGEVNQTSITAQEILNKIDRSNFQLNSLEYLQTQDRGHLFLDMRMQAEGLKDQHAERHWMTLKLDDFSIIHDIQVPFSPSNSDESISLSPFGTLNSQLASLGSLHIKEGFLSLSKPGRDLVLATYRTQSFWQGKTVTVAVHMNNGETHFLPPPQTNMVRSTKAFVDHSSYPEEVAKYDSPMWLSTDAEPEPGHEFLLYYSEANRTYMTVSSYHIMPEADIQLVCQNVQGAYIDRLPKEGDQDYLPIHHFRIRQMDTHDLLHEYSLLSAVPMKISTNEKYMVFMEGTPQAHIMTLRDRFTGRLLDQSPPVDVVHAKKLHLYETQKGITVMGPLKNGIGISVLNFPGE